MTTTDNPLVKTAKGIYEYQSGNDARNPNGFKKYFINHCEVWAYNYKDARMKYKAGLIYKQY